MLKAEVVGVVVRRPAADVGSAMPTTAAAPAQHRNVVCAHR
jgi:hypothetical protein